jgi:hypothetical protein
MQLLIKENESNILIYEQSLYYIKDYYLYILSIIKYVINKNNLSINVILGNIIYDFNNNNKTIKININYEHTLVKKGGRNVENNTPTGIIQYNKDENYLVRIDNNLNDYTDIIIDYSNPNIYNVKYSGYYDDFSHKHIYISPSIYQTTYINMKNRKISSLTTYNNINEPRRHKLLENIKNNNHFNNININNCFDKNDIENLYRDTKVIINIHQTPHHDTFEELRCLPALQNGVIIVAEKSPLNHLIPYNDLIIWCEYDDIINKVKDVLDNYEEYHSKIFTNDNVTIINNMIIENNKTMEYKILNCCYKSLDNTT